VPNVAIVLKRRSSPLDVRIRSGTAMPVAPAS
jgi:hypothetical protein